MILHSVMPLFLATEQTTSARDMSTLSVPSLIKATSCLSSLTSHDKEASRVAACSARVH